MPNNAKNNDDLDLTISDSDEEKAPRKGVKALFASKIFLAATVVVLLGVMAAVWFALKPSAEKPEEEASAPKTQSVDHKAKVFFPSIIDLGIFQVPLGDMGGERSLKVILRIEASDPSLKQEIDRRNVQIKGMITSLMGIKTMDELTGTDGKIVLKNEIIASLNRMLETGKALNVYFGEYIIY